MFFFARTFDSIVPALCISILGKRQSPGTALHHARTPCEHFLDISNLLSFHLCLSSQTKNTCSLCLSHTHIITFLYEMDSPTFVVDMRMEIRRIGAKACAGIRIGSSQLRENANHEQGTSVASFSLLSLSNSCLSANLSLLSVRSTCLLPPKCKIGCIHLCGVASHSTVIAGRMGLASVDSRGFTQRELFVFME